MHGFFYFFFCIFELIDFRHLYSFSNLQKRRNSNPSTQMEKVGYGKTGSKHCRLREERPPSLHLGAMETQLLCHRVVSTPVL